MKTEEWFKPNRFPDVASDAPDISVTVLLYDYEFDMHGLGWYNFDTCKWNAFEEFYLDNKWEWSYLPKPKKK